MNQEKSTMPKEVVYEPPTTRLVLPPGVLNICPGCGHYLVTTLICQAIEELGIQDRTMHVNSIGCAAICGAIIMEDWCGCSHGTAPAVATGLKRVHPDAVVFTMQGDGDAIAIGAGALINAAARAEKVTVFMLNNTNYGTTGGQQAPTTLLNQVTATTPEGRDASRDGYPIHTAELLASMKSVAYSARGAVNSPKNFQATKKPVKAAFQRQMENVGFTFVEILSQCPTNWHKQPVEAAKWVDDVVTKEFPLGEFKNVDSLD